MLGDRARPVLMMAGALAVAGLAIAFILGWISDHSLRRFFFAYLTAFVFFLSLSLGALFMVLMQFLTRAGWSVTVRRTAENVAGLMPMLGILAIPLIATVAYQHGTVYRWALPMSAASPQAIEAASRHEAEEPDEASQADATAPTLDAITLQKRPWMNPIFWIIRVVGYFFIWSCMALYYRRLSILQDENPDPELTRKRQIWSGICVVILGLTLTGGAGDLIMSLDPHWYSTIFGVYYFAGSAVGSWALLILITRRLQKAGFLTKSVTVEHYHDLGKYLFGFTFFFGYIAFSQYMLLWYASIPEEIQWFDRHGATTVHGRITAWSFVILAILFGQFAIPFAGLLSRHIKRDIGLLVLWACWVLTFHYIDTYWMVMPEYQTSWLGGALPGWIAPFHVWTILIDLAALLGMGGLLAAVLVRLMAPHSLRPTGDPRLPESLAFQNF